MSRRAGPRVGGSMGRRASRGAGPWSRTSAGGGVTNVGSSGLWRFPRHMRSKRRRRFAYSRAPADACAPPPLATRRPAPRTDVAESVVPAAPPPRRGCLFGAPGRGAGSKVAGPPVRSVTPERRGVSWRGGRASDP